MSASHIHSLSPELLCQVLGSCDSLGQVRSLSATCKKLNSVWKSNSSSILASVAPRCIPGFDEALVASRVISLVKNAILNGSAPPKSDNIDIASFSAKVSRPRICEIPHVLHLHGLTNIVENAYLNGQVSFEKYDICWGAERPSRSRGPSPLDGWSQELKESFHRAVYRVLLTGPVVAGWYLEPFSTNGTPNILPRDMPPNLRKFIQGQATGFDLVEQVDLEDQDFAYLEKHIAFDQAANARLTETQDSIFGSISSWVISSIRKHITPHDIAWAREKWPTQPGKFELLPRHGFLGLADASLEETRVALREVMRMVVAYEYLANIISNFDGRMGHGRNGSEEEHEPLNVFPHVPQSSATTAIILGVYQLEDLRFADGGIVASPTILEFNTRAKILGGENLAFLVDINLLQDCIYRESGRVNAINGALIPPPNLQLFTFILNRSFGLQFQDDHLFETPKYNRYFDYLLDDSTIFDDCKVPHRGSWIDLLMPTSQSPVYSYRQIS